MISKKNNFDILRLIAASLVFVSHMSVLAGRGEVLLFPNFTAGKMGVWVFFTISGYLITKSWIRNKSILIFFVNRFLRIWPALIFVVFACVFLLGPLVSEMNLNSYLTNIETYNYLKIIIMEIAFTLPGVFDDNYTNSVNGSLWTIPIEVKCYAYLGILGALGIFRYKAVTFIFLFVFISLPFVNNPIVNNANYASYELISVFCIGVLLCLLEEHWSKRRKEILLGSMFFSLLLFFFDYTTLFLWLVLPLNIIIIGSSKKLLPIDFRKIGDFSYGLYIYAFPVQQTVIHFYSEWSYVYVFSAAYIVTFILAILSWFLVEKPCLKLKPR